MSECQGRMGSRRWEKSPGPCQIRQARGGMVTLMGVLEHFVASLTEEGRGLWACLQLSVSPSDSPDSPSRTQAVLSWCVTAAWLGRKVRQRRGTGTRSLVQPLHTAPWPGCQAHPLHGLS